VEHFISVGQNAVVLVDGFEYLIAHNDFSSVLALLHDLNEIVALHDAILLIPMDPSSFNEREFALIRRETCLLGPLATEFREVAEVRA
jgi:archaellum biogenesis ATPase FlaH